LIAEIHTLERHIEHLTSRLELQDKAMRELEAERNAIWNDMNSANMLS